MRLVFAIFIPTLLFFTISLANNMQIQRVISVYDGDTLRVDLDCDTEIFCKNIPVRVYGIDTPEIKGKNADKANALKAKYFLQQSIQNAKTIELHDIKRGKYFRIVGKLMLDGEDIAQIMISQNLGYPYFGGTKKK